MRDPTLLFNLSMKTERLSTPELCPSVLDGWICSKHLGLSRSTFQSAGNLPKKGCIGPDTESQKKSFTFTITDICSMKGASEKNVIFYSFSLPGLIGQHILGPPKHVLHLVCIVLGISTAIKTALKVTDRLF